MASPLLTLDQVRDLQAKGVYSQEQADKYVNDNGLGQSAPTTQGPGMLASAANAVQNALYEPGADKPAPMPVAPQVVGPVAANTQVQPAPVAPQASTPAPQAPVASPSPTTNPANIAAAKAVLGQSGAASAPPPSPTAFSGVPAANPMQGPEGKDARADTINSQADAAKAQIQAQIAANTQDGEVIDINKDKALQVQLMNVDKQKTDMLNANSAAYKMYVKDADGNTHLDSSQLGSITPRQKADYELENQKLEQTNLEKAQKAEQEGVAAQTAAQTAHNDAVASTYSNLAQQQKSDALAKAARDAAFQSDLAQKNDQINKSIQDFNNAKVDPNTYWEKTSTAGLIGTALVAGLVGGLNGVNNVQGNSVLDRVNQFINNDIDAQKANIANKGKGIEFQNSALASFERQGYDKEQSIALTQAASYDAVKTQLQGQLAQTDNAAAKASGQILLAQLHEKAAQARTAALTPYVNANLAAKTVVPVGPGSGKQTIQDKKTGLYHYVSPDGTVDMKTPVKESDINSSIAHRKGEAEIHHLENPTPAKPARDMGSHVYNATGAVDSLGKVDDEVSGSNASFGARSGFAFSPMIKNHLDTAVVQYAQVMGITPEEATKILYRGTNIGGNDQLHANLKGMQKEAAEKGQTAEDIRNNTSEGAPPAPEGE